MTWSILTSCQAAGPHFSLELIVWLIKCTPPSSGGMQLPTRVQQKEAWIIINKKIRGGSSDAAGASGALHNFIPICHLSRSARTHAQLIGLDGNLCRGGGAMVDGRSPTR